MKNLEQGTFWQFTIENAKEAIKLYFRPVRQVAAWLGDDELVEEASRDSQIAKIKQSQLAVEARLRQLERQGNPAFDSLDDVSLRIKRLATWLETHSTSALAFPARLRLQTLETQLSAVRASAASAEEEALSDIRHKLRQLEVDLGFEQPLQWRGASGD